MMKSKIKIIYAVFLAVLFLVAVQSCKKDNLMRDYYIAKVVDYDQNCSTCVLSFPYESNISQVFGESPDNYYLAVNLGENDFEVGQLLKLKLREAKASEQLACITQFPGNNYKNLFINFDDMVLNDTIELKYKDCFYDRENSTYFSFDSVLTDSRCPKDVECIWAGEAIARFIIKKKGENPVYLDLLVGTADTTVNNYKITFTDLAPYPSTWRSINYWNYIAKIVIKRKS